MISNHKTVDEIQTAIGIRSFVFDPEKGFLLNGRQIKINGVCDHHDLGCLGAAINTRALERQLEILKAMGCNGIRTSHNPPAPELLDLCDKMGFIVMDEGIRHVENSKNINTIITWTGMHGIRRIWKIKFYGTEIIPAFLSGVSAMKFPSNMLKTAALIKLRRSFVASSGRWIQPGPLRLRSMIRTGKQMAFCSLVLWILLDTTTIRMLFPHSQNDFPGKKFIGTETVSALGNTGTL